jgi:hypothetical protein
MLGADKANMRALILDRASWSPAEMADIRRYCKADFSGTVGLAKHLKFLA